MISASPREIAVGRSDTRMQVCQQDWKQIDWRKAGDNASWSRTWRLGLDLAIRLGLVGQLSFALFSGILGWKIWRDQNSGLDLRPIRPVACQ